MSHELFEKYLSSRGEIVTAFSSPGFATLLNLQSTMIAEATSIADCMPKNTREREDDSDPKPIEMPPSAPLYTTLMMLMIIAHCWRKRYEGMKEGGSQ